MRIVNLNEMELMEGWFSGDATVRFRAKFALSGGNGAAGLASVYVVLEPGQALGEHTDSPEELLLVLAGEVEFAVGEERARAGAGEMAVVPPMVSHGIRNVGTTTARIIGFFPSPIVVATFVEPIQPIGQDVMIFGETPATTDAAA
jgi:quercetin dioxygenase-like cupin family protein